MRRETVPPPSAPADHGGGIDAACREYGGAREEWLDLSTGINPVPYPLPAIPDGAWTVLPDQGAEQALLDAARRFWAVPETAGIVAAPGTSALIARLPHLAPPGRVRIPGPTYNEHARSFLANGWRIAEGAAEAVVLVNPNNPDGRVHRGDAADAQLAIIDESFADVVPDTSLIALASRPGTLVLKGLGKFWGLAGLRLGFAIGDPALVARLATLLGPWPVSGPALAVGTVALADRGWADATRDRLAAGAARLDALMAGAGAEVIGGTPLFRLARVPEARRWQAALARRGIWTRAFPYDPQWLRLGQPGTEAGWARLAAALEEVR